MWNSLDKKFKGIRNISFFKLRLKQLFLTELEHYVSPSKMYFLCIFNYVLLKLNNIYIYIDLFKRKLKSILLEYNV